MWVQRQHANVRFVTGVKELALSIGRDGENLTFVTGGYKESAVRAERKAVGPGQAPIVRSNEVSAVSSGRGQWLSRGGIVA